MCDDMNNMHIYPTLYREPGDNYFCALFVVSHIQMSINPKKCTNNGTSGKTLLIYILYLKQSKCNIQIVLIHLMDIALL